MLICKQFCLIPARPLHPFSSSLAVFLGKSVIVLPNMESVCPPGQTPRAVQFVWCKTQNTPQEPLSENGLDMGSSHRRRSACHRPNVRLQRQSPSAPWPLTHILFPLCNGDPIRDGCRKQGCHIQGSCVLPSDLKSDRGTSSRESACRHCGAAHCEQASFAVSHSTAQTPFGAPQARVGG